MFFKYMDGVLLFGRVVSAPTFELTIETKDDFDYPMDGWHWFESEEQARAFFGIVADAIQ